MKVYMSLTAENQFLAVNMNERELLIYYATSPLLWTPAKIKVGFSTRVEHFWDVWTIRKKQQPTMIQITFTYLIVHLSFLWMPCIDL
jgi:hypothetical protein